MSESFITISVAGVLAGFIFSMPIAGPISILVTSNALKGRLKYCNLLTIGASFADLIYVFAAVYGITRFFSSLKPAIPYVMLAGSVFIIITAYIIFRSKIDLDHMDDKVDLPEQIKKRGKGGFYTGFFVNLLNPTIFFGWFTTSFVIISIVSSLGFNTGGLNSMIDQNIDEINNLEGNIIEKPDLPSYLRFDTLKILKKETIPAKTSGKLSPNFSLLLSLSFAASIAIGSIIWFYLLAIVIYRFRKIISIRILNLLINSLGIILGICGFFIMYEAFFRFF